MKYLFGCLPEIKKKMARAKGCLLMLDFDGTLSPIAEAPGQAFLPREIKRDLQKCALLFPVAIVSGRALTDIKRKVGLKNIIYAGNHGLQWQIGGKMNYAPGAKEAARPLALIKQSLEKLRSAYPGVLLEYKGLSLAIHYRRLSPALTYRFKKDIRRIIIPLVSGKNIQILNGKKTIELRPNMAWHKGKFAIFIRNYFENKSKRKLLPVYVGDDITDEDAFRSLKSGVAIKVGQSKASRAKYYIKNPAQAGGFMRWLLKAA